MTGDLLQDIFNRSKPLNKINTGYIILKHYVPIPIIICSMICILITILVAMRKGLWRPTSQYLITLALVDLLSMPLLLFLTLDSSKFPEKKMEATYLIGDMLEILLIASNWITTVVAAERFFAITYPLKTYRLRRKHRRMLVVGVLMLSFTLKLPNILIETNKTSERRSIHPLILHFNTWIVQVLFYMLIPFIILVVVNVKLIQELLKMSKYFGSKFEKGYDPSDDNQSRAASCFKRMCPFKYFMIGREVKSRCIDPTFMNSRHRKKSFREERRIITTLVMLILTFFIFQAPFVIVSVYENVRTNYLSNGNFTFKISRATTYFKTLSIPALALKSVFYFVFYCWFCNKFMKTMQNLFNCATICSRNSPKNQRNRIPNNHQMLARFNQNKTPQGFFKRRSLNIHDNPLRENGKFGDRKNFKSKLLYIYERDQSREMASPSLYEDNISKICYLNTQRPCKHHHIPSSLYVYIDKPEIVNCKRCYLSSIQRDSTTTEETDEPIRTPLGYNYYSNHAFSSFLMSNASSQRPSFLDRESEAYYLDQDQIVNQLSRESKFLSNSDNNIDYYSSNYAIKDLGVFSKSNKN